MYRMTWQYFYCCRNLEGYWVRRIAKQRINCLKRQLKWELWAEDGVLSSRPSNHTLVFHKFTFGAAPLLLRTPPLTSSRCNNTLPADSLTSQTWAHHKKPIKIWTMSASMWNMPLENPCCILQKKILRQLQNLVTFFFIWTFLSMWKASQLPGAAARTWVQQQVSIRRRPGHLDHQLDQTTFVRSHHHLSFSLVLWN